MVIAIENLAPLYPGRETVSTVPVALRSLVAQIGSPALRLCLDVGHANVIAGLRRTTEETLNGAAQLAARLADESRALTAAASERLSQVDQTVDRLETVEGRFASAIAERQANL